MKPAILVVVSAMMAFGHLCNSVSYGKELSAEEQIKTHAGKITEDISSVLKLVDSFPRLKTDSTPYERFIRLKSATPEELTPKLEQVIALHLDTSKSPDHLIDRRLIALEFRSQFALPCQTLLDNIGKDYAKINKAGKISDDLEVWKWFITIDVCTKIIPANEAIIDQVCISLLCTDTTLIKIKQQQVAAFEGARQIYEELRGLNTNLTGFLTMLGQRMAVNQQIGRR